MKNKKNITKPKVSVCCATYNQEKFIGQALESIFMQETSFPFEVLVHDDASTDGTQKIIRQFEKKHPNLRAIIQKENQFSKREPICASFVLPHVQGKYVILNDGDDFFTDPLKLQKQADYLDQHPGCSLCFHPVQVLHEDGSQPDFLYPATEMLEGKKILTLDDLLKANFIQTNSCMYRWAYPGNKIKNIFPKNIAPGDYFLHILHAKHGDIGFIDEVMATYRLHKTSLWWGCENTDVHQFYRKYGKRMVAFHAAVRNLLGKRAEEFYKLHTLKTIEIVAYQYVDSETVDDLFYLIDNSKESRDITRAIARGVHLRALQAANQLVDAKRQHEALSASQTELHEALFASQAELLEQTRQHLQSVLISRSWKITQPLRTIARHGRNMLVKLHNLLVRSTLGFCLLPAGVLYQNGRWLKNIARGKFFFTGLIDGSMNVIRFAQTKGRITRVLIKGSLGVSLALHKTRSFRKTLRYIFGVLGGNPAFGQPIISAAQYAPLGSAQELYAEYITFITNRSVAEKSADFVPLTTERHDFSKTATKLIAFYLPQFHSFPLNDEWYGKGFTEWTNVTKSIPQYTGHYQPHLPIDTGYYDLNDINVMKRQVELAELYGIHAFCFHYYWFSGTRLMEMPIFNWLRHPEIDFPFCLNWANENWSKLWDGGNKEVRYKQELAEGDDERFFEDILPFLEDRRYIKVNGKPLLIVYRPHLFKQERFIRFTEIMREKAKAEGFADLYMVAVNSHNFMEDPVSWGMDAMLEFPPHCMQMHGLQPKSLPCFVNPHYDGRIWDGADYIEKKRFLYPANYKLFKGVCPSWDNSPRKAYSNGSIIDGITPDRYEQWLRDCIDYTQAHHGKNEQFVFINAWNEWAESAHLEPDSRYGYAYLQATRNALFAGEKK